MRLVNCDRRTFCFQRSEIVPPLSGAGVSAARVASVLFVGATGSRPTRGMLVNKAKDMGDGTGFDSGPYQTSDDRPVR
jgi:hypothetical protein